MLSMDRIHRIPQFGARVGRSAHPLRVLDRNGTFPARGTATGRRYHTEADALRFPGGGHAGTAGLDRGLLPGVQPGAAGRPETSGVRDGSVRPGSRRGRGRVAVGNRGRPGLQARGVPVADGTHREAGDRPPADGPQGPSDPFRVRLVRALRHATRLHHHGRQPGEPVAPRRRWSRI